MTQDMNHNDMKRNMRNMAIRCNSRLLRSLLLLTLATVGATGAWGQTGTDYSGTWYIGTVGYNASTPANNYYLCPTEGWIFYKPNDDWSNDGTTYPNPFLTTFKCKTDAYASGAINAIWVIEKRTGQDSEQDYYSIRHYNSENKYLLSNGQISGTSNANRMRVHLEEVSEENLDDKALFSITPYSGYLVISPKSSDGWNGDYKWYTVNGGNTDFLVGKGKDGGPNGYKETGGILGLYSQNDGNAKFYLENAKCTLPTAAITENNEVMLTSTEEATIHYSRSEGLTPPDDPDINATDNIYSPDNMPTINTTTTIKAVAVKDQMVDSDVATISFVLNPTINLSKESYTYCGEEIKPEISVEVGEITIPGSNYDVVYSNNTNAGNNAKITIVGREGGNYYVIGGERVFTINKAPLTIAAKNMTITYGEEPANDGVTFSGFFGNDNESVIEGELSNLTYVYSYSQFGDVGEYTITPSGDGVLSSNNYDIVFAPGTLTVAPKSIGDGNRPALGIHVTMEKNGDDYVVTVIDEEIGDGTTLTEGENNDYTISTETESDGDIVTITGQNNYTGSAKAVYATAVFYRQEETVPFAAVYNSKVDVMPPQAVTVYVVKKVNASIGTVTITPVSYIPADVPVVLEAETNLSGFAASPIDESVVPVTDALVSSNLLKVAPSGGVPVESTEAYMFYLGEFVLTQQGTIAEGKFFLYNPNYKSRGGASARSLRIVKEDNDTTGIENIQMTIGNTPLNGIWHTLDGRRLNGRPSQKGLYIVNGKKVKI